MQDERLEEKFITAFDDTIKAVFGEDMIKTGDCRAFDHMGHFELSYNYLPYNYSINLEHEMGFVDIRIIDSQNAWAYFTKITQYHIQIIPSFRKDEIKKPYYFLKICWKKITSPFILPKATNYTAKMLRVLKE